MHGLSADQEVLAVEDLEDTSWSIVQIPRHNPRYYVCHESLYMDGKRERGNLSQLIESFKQG